MPSSVAAYVLDMNAERSVQITDYAGTILHQETFAPLLLKTRIGDIPGFLTEADTGRIITPDIATKDMIVGIGKGRPFVEESSHKLLSPPYRIVTFGVMSDAKFRDLREKYAFDLQCYEGIWIPVAESYHSMAVEKAKSTPGYRRYLTDEQRQRRVERIMTELALKDHRIIALGHAPSLALTLESYVARSSAA
jgi:hypothetical protein